MQVDYTSALLHADIDQEVFIEMPRGYKDPGKVLKLKKSLYGLKQSPRNFFLHLKSKLESLDFIQSSADLCLFIRSDMICLVYVYDCLFFAPDDSKFGYMLSKLRKAGRTLEKEDNVAGFLGVHLNVDHTDGTIELTQVGLIDRIVSAIVLTDATEVKTPAENGALQTDEDRENCDT